MLRHSLQLGKALVDVVTHHVEVVHTSGNVRHRGCDGGCALNATIGRLERDDDHEHGRAPPVQIGSFSTSDAPPYPALLDHNIPQVWHVDDIHDRVDLHIFSRGPSQMLPLERKQRGILVEDAFDVLEHVRAGLTVGHCLGF